jgi:hypothetical protein
MVWYDMEWYGIEIKKCISTLVIDVPYNKLTLTI